MSYEYTLRSLLLGAKMPSADFHASAAETSCVLRLQWRMSEIPLSLVHAALLFLCLFSYVSAHATMHIANPSVSL